MGLIYLFFPNARDDSIRRLNICAEQIYNQLNTAQDGVISIPDDSTDIAGEYGNTYMLIYASPCTSNESQYLYGNESDDNHIFWAAKLSDKKIESVWCSEHLISENEMHEYSYEQQKNSIHFVTPITSLRQWMREGWVDDSMVVGFFKGENKSS